MGVKYLYGIDVTGQSTFSTNVGIGTLSPGQKLSVIGASSTDAFGLFSGGSGGTKGGIYLGNDGSQYGSLWFDNATNDVVLRQNYSNGNLIFGTNSTEKVRITSVGNVGIGTTSPGFKLDVVGDGRFSNSGSSDTLTLSHSSGSGIALNISKGGSGEGLYVNKTSGSGNAVTVIGTLNATTLVKNGGTSTQYLMADGSVSTLTNPVTGTGTTNYLPKWTSGSAIGNSIVQDLTNYISVAGYAIFNRGTLSFTLNPSYGGGNVYTQLQSTGALSFATGGDNNRVYIDTSGNVGIGTTSPTGTYGKLTVAGGIHITNDNNAKFEIGRYSAGAPHSYIKLGASSNSLRFTNNADAADLMELTNSGNLGLGVTPSAWGSGFLGFDIGGTTATVISSLSRNIIASNSYYDGTNYIYKVSDYALQQVLDRPSGAFKWNIAPSGTAGNAITFTQAMTLAASGNLLIGTTADNGYKLDVNGTGRFSGANNAIIDLYNTALADANARNWRIVTNESSWGALEFRVSTANNNAPSSPKLILSKDGAATFSSSVTISSNNILALNNSDNTNNFQIYNSGATGSGNGNLIFTQGAVGERMRITSAGNVGIGTTSPGTKLEVYSIVRVTESASGGILQLEANAGVVSITSTFYGGTYKPMTFLNGGSERMRLDTSGNLGIGTTAPAAKLDVEGDVSIKNVNLSNQENLDVDTGTEVISIAPIALYTAAFFDFVVKNGTNVRSGTVYACHDGTSVEYTETSTADLGNTSAVVFTVDISAGNMRLLATTTTDNWSIKTLTRTI